MRAFLLLPCVLSLTAGCTSLNSKPHTGDSADDDSGLGPATYGCTTDADGLVSCEGLGWDDQVDEDGLLSMITSDVCSSPYDDGYDGWICAVAGVLALKAQTFGVDPSDYSTAGTDVFDKVQQFWVSYNNTGGASTSIGDCPDSLRDSSVFNFTWCNRPSTASDANMVFAMNTLQDCLLVHAAADRADVGIWTGVSLVEVDEKSQDDLWLAVFWSLLHFHTASTLRYGHAAGADGSVSELVDVDISGVDVRPEWSAEEASGLGLSEDEAAALIQDFVDDPISNAAPEGLHVRLRFLRVDFADSYSGAASWPGTDPQPVFRTHGALTEGPWHLASQSGSPPIAIIDPVVDDPGGEAEGDTGGTSSALGVSVQQGPDELSRLTAFVDSARAAGWSVAFGDED